ncbi:LysR family transcriptional regulator [Aquincola sp. MAHUQ-54]|uniref:LysR family transcriptional regulator n=1 Tax=Aquincola agrisoli TaxID=3119538 RepID=A0AAW9QLT6_9BURK
MKFDLADLRAFLAVADLGSFRAASQALHLSQSAASRRIDKLEEALGVELFLRTTRRVELTTIGRTFIHRARAVINDLESALVGIADFADRISGEVSVACVPSAVGYFLPGVIERFHRLHPRIRVRLIDESSSELLLAVANGEADLGLTYIGTQEPDIEFEPLLEDLFVVACPKEHPLARRQRVSWAELAPYDQVSLAHGSGNRFLIDQALAQVEHKPEWFCEVRHVPALVSLVEAGLGIGVVPQLALPPRGRLVSVELEAPTVSRTIGIIRRRGRALRPPAELFQRLLMELTAQQRAPRPAAGRPRTGSPPAAGRSGVPRRRAP